MAQGPSPFKPGDMITRTESAHTEPSGMFKVIDVSGNYDNRDWAVQIDRKDRGKLWSWRWSKFYKLAEGPW